MRVIRTSCGIIRTNDGGGWAFNTSTPLLHNGFPRYGRLMSLMLHCVEHCFVFRKFEIQRSRFSAAGWTRTTDLQVMSLTR